MKAFKPALWDGSDPTYSPCTSTTAGIAYWKAPARYRKAGYAVTIVKLGRVDDGRDLDRAAKARELTREMVRWFDGDDAQKIAPNTWAHLIACYRSDDVSPMRDVKANTRQDYLERLAYWQPVIGHMQIADMTFIEAKRIVRGMQDKGRSPHFIKSKFTMLRILAGYAVALKMPGARDVRDVLGELRLKSPKPRTVSPTAEQVMAIIAKADESGDHAFALGLLIQWHLTFRAIDVRGDWFRLQDGEDRSGILRGRQRWGDGLTWDMIDRDVTTLTKAAGIPDSVWMMDTRAGAINDAKRKGADPLALQQQANHADFKTTQRYLREKSDGANNVLRLRAERS